MSALWHVGVEAEPDGNELADAHDRAIFQVCESDWERLPAPEEEVELAVHAVGYWLWLRTTLDGVPGGQLRSQVVWCGGRALAADQSGGVAEDPRTESVALAAVRGARQVERRLKIGAGQEGIDGDQGVVEIEDQLEQDRGRECRCPPHEIEGTAHDVILVSGQGTDDGVAKTLRRAGVAVDAIVRDEAACRAVARRCLVRLTGTGKVGIGVALSRDGIDGASRVVVNFHVGADELYALRLVACALTGCRGVAGWWVYGSGALVVDDTAVTG